MATCMLWYALEVRREIPIQLNTVATASIIMSDTRRSIQSPLSDSGIFLFYTMIM